MRELSAQLTEGEKSPTGFDVRSAFLVIPHPSFAFGEIHLPLWEG